MLSATLAMAALFTAQTTDLDAGRHARQLTVGEEKRSYHVHVPASYDPKTPTPVVVALHGAVMNGSMMEIFSGLSKKAEESGFIVVYPNGTGAGGILLTWNAGRFPGNLRKDAPDDVAFLGKVLDDVGNVLNVDKGRVYVTGMSNGAMMAYRLAVEMPERIAAIAPVGGVMVLDNPNPKVPIPVLHIHGTKDPLVPFEGSKKGGAAGLVSLPSVEESLAPWIKVNRCSETPAVTELPLKADKLQVIRKDYTTEKSLAPVVLYVVEGGGHTWPGMSFHAAFLGATTYNISTNDVMWEFFRQHTRKAEK